MKRRTRRIYYGPPGAEKQFWWTVKARDAKQSVSINGSLMHALKGRAGVVVGCTFSKMATDKSNAQAFPHKVYLAAFTESTALLVDSLKANGEPKTAVLYEHSYRDIVDCNDERKLKKMAIEHPEIIERSFTLRVPRSKRYAGGPNSGRPIGARKSVEHPHNFIPRGSLKRAVKAGLIGKHVAEQIADVAAR